MGNQNELEDQNEMDEGEELYIDIEFPDGRVVEYEILGMFGIGESHYLALYPTEQEGGEVQLFPIEDGPDGTPEFREFFDDEEYEVASQFFETWVNEGTDVLLEKFGATAEEAQRAMDAEDEEALEDDSDENEEESWKQ